MTFAAIAQAEPPFILTLTDGVWIKSKVDIGTDLASALVFTDDGRLLLIGTTGGCVAVYSVNEKKVVAELKVQGLAAVLGLHLSRRYIIYHSRFDKIHLRYSVVNHEV